MPELQCNCFFRGLLKVSLESNHRTGVILTKTVEMALSDFRKQGYLSITWRFIDFDTSGMDTLYKSHYET